MVSFAEPRWLWALAAPVALAAGAWARHRWRLERQRLLAAPGVWRRAMGGAPATGLVRMWLTCGALAMLVVALARPQWGEVRREAPVRTRDVVVALDVSDSMRCPDVAPSRLARGIAVVRGALPALAGDRLAVEVFAGESYPLVPLTVDLDAVAAFLQSVEPGMVALPGSDLERAVEGALELLPEEGTGRVVVLVSDGENLQGSVEEARRRLERAGVQVVGLLAGTAEGGPIPLPSGGGTAYKRDRSGRPVVTRARRDVLERLAGPRGALVDAAAPDAPRRLAEAVAAIQSRAGREALPVERVERFPLALAAAAALLTLAFAVPPWRRLAAAALLLSLTVPAGAQAVPGPPPSTPPPAPAAAPSPGPAVRPPWWQRWIPGGVRRLARSGLAAWRRHQLDRAARRFAEAAALAPDDPERAYDLGTVLAARGRLREAERALSRAAVGGLEAAAAYNLGTAALEAGDPGTAVRWLRRALLADPDDPAVKRNYELALRRLRRREAGRRDRREERRSRPRPTPTPRPRAAPRPTPSPHPGIYAAIERAEREARRRMVRGTPRPVTVERDW